ncbi:MAG TPA: TetR/AcrR family transcriptional regulator [Xanthobacteraceae bacterium]|nr:TetR/AcrR family transcriptional regulator [Xanthobacteraceae bacterium]
MAKRAALKRKREPEGRLARDRVFETAADLFYRKGVRAVGVEAIVQQAGVAKISLYRSFPSKDALVVAYLERRNADFWRQWDEAFAKYKNAPRAQLRAIMTYLARRTSQPGYRGCPFINYCAEFPEPPNPGRKVAEANKREMRSRFTAMAKALGAKEPKQLADGLLLLVEGAYAISQSLGGAHCPSKAITGAAEALVEAQLPR